MWEINTLQMVLIFESRTEIPKLLLSFTLSLPQQELMSEAAFSHSRLT